MTLPRRNGGDGVATAGDNAMIVTDETAERLADPAVHRLLITACDARGIARRVVLDLLDTGEGCRRPCRRFRCTCLSGPRRSGHATTSDMARRARRQRTARALLRIVGEQARCADLAAAAETLAKLLAADSR